MENFPTSSPAPVIPPKSARPNFLTVLCILTFIGSGIGLILNLSNYMTADVSSAFQKETIDSVSTELDKKVKEGDKGAAIAEKMISASSSLMDPEKKKKDALYSTLSNVLTLAGAFLMFKLKKNGFWLYVLGTIISIGSPILIYGTSNILSMGITAFFGFFGIVFVILYAMNLKFLK